MKKILDIFQRKPPVLVLVGLIYLLAAGFLKWRLHPPVDALYFVGGGFLGIYFLDAAEIFFHLTPSPFRSIVFVGLYTIVSLFVVTSSSSFIARGLVLMVHLMLFLLQLFEWQKAGNLSSWYQMVVGTVSTRTQELLLAAFGLVFFAETYLFVR